jgi:branched-chain amino acid transport system permease protein
LESLVGAVVGGLLLGLVLAFVLTYISGSLVFITAFGVLIVVLLVKPGGLIGSKRGRRA